VNKQLFKSKTFLKFLIGAGVLAVIGGGAGTFASFNATTTNAGNTFATGTLVLSNNIGASTCLSTGGGNTNSNTNSTGCGKFFDVSVKEPGDTGGAQLTLQNAGSLAASTLTLTATSCTDADASGESFHGTGSVCGALNTYVQEWTDNTFTTPYKCWYGGSTDSGVTCDSTWATASPLSGLGTSPNDISVGPNATAFAANGSSGDTRFFTVAVQLPNSGNQNDLQGRQASLDLTWEESQ
jgi:predicted ribosomally synthesized peptide with SipW-like signal peptide